MAFKTQNWTSKCFRHNTGPMSSHMYCTYVPILDIYVYILYIYKEVQRCCKICLEVNQMLSKNKNIDKNKLSGI